MSDTTTALERPPAKTVLLGDEAVALGAIHAGISCAYAYPGTPSTEILEYVLRHKEEHGVPYASWSANEKTAYESGLGTSLAGRRAMVSMKHVGLNVAADPFINSAIVKINGGLVAAVGDDPGMHSSQNEQDSRYYADFAHVICLEPADQQQAYDMTREAFDLSERFNVPVVVRVVTRLAHSRAPIETNASRLENQLQADPDHSHWVLLPGPARKQWAVLLDRHREMRAWSDTCAWNPLELNRERRELGVITCGVARNYYLECLDDLGWRPSHLHVGAYPMPAEKIRELAGHVGRILVLEDGYQYVERFLRGIIPPDIEILGKETGHVPATGELSPEAARRALGLEVPRGLSLEGLELPARPPRLCDGCPHSDAYGALNRALAELDGSVVTIDIGCYTLGFLPPHSVGESCVCMGASIGMAKGAAEAGRRPAVAVIGDSTFLHSGVTGLMDCVAANTPMTLLILDNQTVAMTGTQPPVLPSEKLEQICLGVGVDPEHCHLLEAHPKRQDELVETLKRELAYEGLSVVISHRECLEAVRKRRADERRASARGEVAP
jgi:indolepyruvate ferredoxin oxidoreductase alpha subunit